jgi:hypothetical protein
MADKKFNIFGRVVDREYRTALSGCLIEAWDSDLLVDDFVGCDTTDAEGKFRIEFSQQYFRELFFDSEPDLYFKIFKRGQLIASTEDSVLWNVRAGELEIDIEVDPEGA